MSKKRSNGGCEGCSVSSASTNNDNPASASTDDVNSHLPLQVSSWSCSNNVMTSKQDKGALNTN
jgi:hypothetical protein